MLVLVPLTYKHLGERRGKKRTFPPAFILGKDGYPAVASLLALNLNSRCLSVREEKRTGFECVFGLGLSCAWKLMIFEPAERRERRWVSDTGLLLHVLFFCAWITDTSVFNLVKGGMVCFLFCFVFIIKLPKSD